jgi:hypothetical protein
LTDRRGRFRKTWRASAALALVATAAGCASTQDKADAIKSVNRVFCERYEAITSDRGTRTVHVPREDAYTAMRAALAGMGMKLESQNPKLGVFIVSAPAPLPLDREEWVRASDQDLPLLRQLARPHIGWLTTQLLLHFEPEGLQIVVTVTVLEVPEGSNVSLTVRLREIRPPVSGFPRRECLPPTALSTGLDKIWAAFDRELLGTAGKS